MKKNKILTLLAFTSLTIGATSLISCNNNASSSSSSSESSSVSSSISLGNAVSIYCTGGPKNEYGLNDIIDLSDLNVHIIYENGQDVIYYSYSSKVSITGSDTSTLGAHILLVTCEGLTYEYNFTVVEAKGHFDFNGGSVEGDLATDVDIVDGQIDVSNIQPSYTDEDGTFYKFAGWFTDKELTQRANYVTEGYLDASANRNFYAGYDIDYSDLFNYTVDKTSGTVTIDSFNWDGYLYASITDLYIPETIELYPVTAIADEFAYFKDELFGISISMASFISVEKITFAPGSKVSSIGSSAFAQIKTLKYVEFPESLEIIGDNAFFGTYLTGTLSIPANVKSIGEYAFAYTNYCLLDIDFAENSKLKTIGSYAFANDYNLVNIVLPEGLELIGNYAFSSCEELQYVYIPSTVTEIGLHVFSDDSEISNFEVSPDNKNYRSVDGNLYTKDSKTLIKYANGKREKTFEVPAGVERIEESAFNVYNGNSFLKEIKFNEGLKYIGSSAFSGVDCDLVLPASLNNVAINAFFNYKGSSISVAQENKTFASNNGALYSKDFSELYVVPDEIEVIDFTILDSVKVIKSNAFVKNSNIKYIRICENSQLERIDDSGLNIFAMVNLSGIYIDKLDAFVIDNNAFYNYSAVGYNNPYFVLNESNYDNYSEAWKDYEVTTSSGTSLYLLGRLVTVSDLENLIVEVISDNGFISKSIYDKYDSLGKEQLIISKSYEKSYLDYENSLDYLALFYNLEGRDHSYDSYFFDYEKVIYQSAIQYLGGLSSIGVVNVNSLRKLSTRTSFLPEQLKNKISDEIKEVNSFYDKYLQDYARTKELYQEILDLNSSNDSYDEEGFNNLYKMRYELSSYSFSISASVEKKWNTLLASAYIDTLIDLGTITKENYSYANELIYGSSEYSFESIRGVEQLLEYGLQNEYRQSQIYKIDEYAKIKVEFDAFAESYVEELIAGVNDFDFLTNYDEETYVNFINQIGSFPYFSSKVAPQNSKIYLIFAIYNMNFLTENNSSVNDENLNSILSLSNIIDNQLLSASYIDGFGSDWTFEDLAGYDDYLSLKQDALNYKDNLLTELRNQIDNFSWEDENSDEEFAAMTKNYNTVVNNDLLSELDVYVPEEGYTLLYGLTYQIYVVENNISNLLDNYTEINKDNYFEIYKLIKSYYDFESQENIIGIQEQIDNLGLENESYESLYRIEDLKTFINNFYNFTYSI